MKLLPEIGSHFIVGFAGAELSDAERRLWSELRPAGTIIFKRNLAAGDRWPETLHQTLAELRDLSGREDFIVSVDHEGGRVHRFREPITHFPPPAAWTDSPKAIGAAMGRELRDLGVNLNFAPSFDLLVEPLNKVIGDRSFGPDPAESSRKALLFLEGLESEGVLGCAKHFPGHGGTVGDSHEMLPRVSTPIEVLRERELVPFRDYVASGRQLIMTAHVLFDQIDPASPATLSNPILQGILRDQLGFAGVIITDALDMKAVSGMPERNVAESFMRASGDLFCVCQGPEPKSPESMNTSTRMLPIEAALNFADGLSTSASQAPDLSLLIVKSQERIALFLAHLRAITAGWNSAGTGR